VIVGSYTDASNVTHGFVYSRGKFTNLDFPGSSFTVATAINNSGTIVGQYFYPTGVEHGFRDQNGKFTELDAPGAGTNPFEPLRLGAQPRAVLVPQRPECGTRASHHSQRQRSSAQR
jgi:hypothetical protein